jgi:hypothetical protein
MHNTFYYSFNTTDTVMVEWPFLVNPTSESDNNPRIAVFLALWDVLCDGKEHGKQEYIWHFNCRLFHS